MAKIVDEWKKSGKRVGLCLVGGGLAGCTQAGMIYALRPLFESGVVVAAECSSVGSLNGALLAQAIRYTTDYVSAFVDNDLVDHSQFHKIFELWNSVSRKDVYSRWKVPAFWSSSLFSTKPLGRLIDKHLSAALIEGSGMRLFIHACQRDTGRTMVWSQGSLYQGSVGELKTMLMASSAFPVAFPQVRNEADGMWYVDAGVGDNSPMDCLLGTSTFESVDVILVLHCHSRSEHKVVDKPLCRSQMLFHMMSLIHWANQVRDEDAIMRRNQMIRAGTIKGKVVSIYDIHPTEDHTGVLTGSKDEIQKGFYDGHDAATQFLYPEVS